MNGSRAAEYIAGGVMPLALSLMPGMPDSLALRANLLAIAFKESDLNVRLQVGGPARSFWQFERGGGVAGVRKHVATARMCAAVCELMAVQCTDDGIYIAMADNDVLACCMARLLLYTVPGALAEKGRESEGLRQYLWAWRPGVPNIHKWPSAWARGWQLAEAYRE